MQKRQPLQQGLLGEKKKKQLVNYMEKNEIRKLPNTKHKNKLKWIKDLKVRPETIKLLEENIGRTLSNINHCKILYDLPLRVRKTNTKINKWDIIKLKILHKEGNYKQGEKTTLRVGENIKQNI